MLRGPKLFGFRSLLVSHLLGRRGVSQGPKRAGSVRPRQTFHVAILTIKYSKNANITTAIRLEVMYLPKNGATANAVHHDLEIYFQDHEYLIVNISKKV